MHVQWRNGRKGTDITAYWFRVSSSKQVETITISYFYSLSFSLVWMVVWVKSMAKLMVLVSLWLSVSNIIGAETANPSDDNIPSPVACFNCSLCEYPCNPSPPPPPASQSFAPPPPPPVQSNCPPLAPAQCCQFPPPNPSTNMPPPNPSNNMPYFHYGTAPPLRFSNRSLWSFLSYSLFMFFSWIVF